MSLPPDVSRCLAALAGQNDAPDILCAAPEAPLADLVAVRPDASACPLSPTVDPLESLTGMGRFDLALVVDAPAVLSKKQTTQLLARLRHYHADRVVAAFAAGRGAAWSPGDFLALGFRRLSSARELASDYHVYRYAIRDYKHTPDWLNARHWANPEQWGRHRW